MSVIIKFVIFTTKGMLFVPSYHLLYLGYAMTQLIVQSPTQDKRHLT